MDIEGILKDESTSMQRRKDISHRLSRLSRANPEKEPKLDTEVTVAGYPPQPQGYAAAPPAY